MANRTIKVDYLARVEGEGALTIRYKGREAVEVQLRIFEPPRFFEAFLRGRAMDEAPDITARICGICPVAYQMSSCHALENACGVRVDGPLRELRRLLYCGEWIESHVLHAFLLHAPDFLGFADAIAMAKEHPDWVTRGLRMKKAGNAIVALLGGREIHPVNVRLGGFYRAPTRTELLSLAAELEWSAGAARAAAVWMAGFPYPEFARDYEFVALRHPGEYPFNEGRIVSSKGLDIAVSEYDQYFEEQHVAHSNALHSVLRGKGEYFVGPLARFNLNFDELTPAVRDTAREIGLEPPVTNPFKGLLVRLLETSYACEEALRIIRSYEPPARSFLEVPPRAATGHACTEAPRGILVHRYTIDAEGSIQDAKIVPPTSQNQKSIEADLLAMAHTLADLPLADATWRAEQAVRNYDPCISCATHFLRLDIQRE
jgi:coenzyme F420-reducing hydrogenase alpha subunit